MTLPIDALHVLSPQPAPEPGEASGGLIHRRKLRLGCDVGGGQRRRDFHKGMWLLFYGHS